MDILALLTGPAAWLALLTLIVLEVALGAGGFGFDAPKGYIRPALGFAIAVGISNGLQRNRRKAKLAIKGAGA